MDKLRFRVSTELKTILGRDLITSDNIAVLELVKNSYDAHAKLVEITFGDDEIIISDNGKGMSYDDILNKWLFVGYSAKRDGTEDDSYRSKFKRNFAGAKGIGRISCDRLAQNLTLISKSADSPTTEQLDIDWRWFETDQTKEFDTIEIPHQSLTEIPEFPENSQTGTTLHFRILRSEWTQDRIEALRKSLEKMINPFADIDDFGINIICPAFPDVSGPIKNSIGAVLNLKTTQIESTLKDGIITTTLSDRGTLMYKIEEENSFNLLSDVQINLYYLNRVAKYNFSLKIGVQPVQYGNVFLFRNGFRIFPYGEVEDDSWGLNLRAKQGYNRFLGTRDLLGRVNLETNDVESFKEVSSRDGGLIKTPATDQLMDYFNLIHHRLERYVSGVLWGLGFVSKDYFLNKELAQTEKDHLQEVEKDSESAEHIYDSIGSKVDFLQLIKSLTNDRFIRVLEYNKDLADIVAKVSDVEIIQTQFINDLRKVADKTQDSDLMRKIDDFEQQLSVLRRQKEEAERKAAEEVELRLQAEKLAAIAEKKRKEEEILRKEESAKRKEAEKELEQKTKQNLFLQSVSTLDKEKILNFHHDIRIQAQIIQNFVGNISKTLRKGNVNADEIVSALNKINGANAKILSIVKFATKANFNSSADSIDADIVEYINQYITTVLPDYFNDLHFHCNTNTCSRSLSFKPLEVSLLFDNLVANSVKAKAKNFTVDFCEKEDRLQVSISDDGKGLSDGIKDSQMVFEKGFTTTNGSGLGLYNVAQYVQNTLKGDIWVDEKSHSFQTENNGLKIVIMF